MSNAINDILKIALSRECSKLVYRRELPPNQRVIPRFVIYDVYDPPEDVDVFSYRLRVTGGLVENRVEVPYIDLITKAPCVDLVTDFHCVTGWSVLNVEWRGVYQRST